MPIILLFPIQDPLASSYISTTWSVCHCWWTSEYTRAQVAKFYGLLRSHRSVERASTFSVFKIDLNWNFVDLLDHPFWLQLWGGGVNIIFNFSNYFVWPRNTDEFSVPEMRIWSILLIESDLNTTPCIDITAPYINFITSYINFTMRCIDIVMPHIALTTQDNDIFTRDIDIITRYIDVTIPYIDKHHHLSLLTE